MIGNLKESAVPYLIEQLRLARLSFELFGALSPSEARPAPGQENEAAQREKDNEEKEERSTDSGKSKQRNVSQAELESSLYRVGHPTNSLLSDVAFKVRSRFSQLCFFVLSESTSTPVHTLHAHGRVFHLGALATERNMYIHASKDIYIKSSHR